MHRKVTSAVVARPADEAFAWVTTPGWWPQVSTVTMGIDAADPWRPLRAGDTFREHIRVRAWRGHVDWTVVTVDAHRCVLAGVSSGEGFLSRLTGRDDVGLELTFGSNGVLTRTLIGFGDGVEGAADATMTTIVSMLENPLLFAPQIDRAAESWLHIADPLADEAVASLISPTGDASALERFIGTLYRGDPPPADVPAPMEKFLQATSKLPAWTCQPRLDAASDVFLDWGVLAVGAHICASLPETYVMPRVAKLLNLTRELDADPVHADRRLWFTVRMCFDVLARNGLGAKGEGLLALQRLRLIHATVRLFVQHRVESPHRLSKLTSSALWDTEHGQPISQLELLHTLLTFSHVVVRALEVLGAELTPYQVESYIHLWNVAGVQLGIHPELLPRDAADAAQLFETIKSRYAAQTPESVRLGEALVWFWTRLFPKHVQNEARELMQFVIAQLLSPETARMNGLEDLPAFSPKAAKAVREALDVSGRLFSTVFEDVPGARQAAALFTSLLMKAKTDAFEDGSGTFDIPQELYERWRGIPATA